MTPPDHAAPLLTTARYDLWQPRMGDHEGMLEVIRDEKTRRFLGTFQPSHADSFARLLRNAGSWALWGYGTFAVREHGQDRIVATCGVFRSYRGFGADAGLDDVPEAGWIVHRDHWGQGLATEAMSAVLAWFDATHGRQRIAAMIEEGHGASEAVAAKLGFTRYGSHQPDEGAALGLWERSAR